MTDSLICNLAVFILADQDPSKCTRRQTNSHCGHSVSFDSNKFPLASNHCLSSLLTGTEIRVSLLAEVSHDEANRNERRHLEVSPLVSICLVVRHLC